jgi:DNA-binding XRE family transcriptional regulator
MKYETIIRRGKRFVLVEEAEFRRLVPAAEDDTSLPPLPKPDKNGTMPAVEFARVTIARRIISGRKAAGLSQVALAGLAGVRVETLNRLEKGRHMPGIRTMDKINNALATGVGKQMKNGLHGRHRRNVA